MTTPTIEQIYRHASVRAFTPDPVPAELVETVVAAAQRSSTSSNLQMWTAVAVTAAAARARLAELTGHKHAGRAPVVLVWCADLRRLDRVCALRGYRQVTEYVENLLLAALDAVIAAQTAALAAESLGLGICYLGSIRNQPRKVIDLLELPLLVFPIVGMTLGWPEARPPIRPRLPLRAVLHWERYGAAAGDEALHEYDRAMIDTGIYAGRQVPLPGAEGVAHEPLDVHDYGWLEHSARRASQPWRTELRAALREQGFELK